MDIGSMLKMITSQNDQQIEEVKLSGIIIQILMQSIIKLKAPDTVHTKILLFINLSFQSNENSNCKNHHWRCELKQTFHLKLMDGFISSLKLSVTIKNK